jgi:His/Glu/Gln/Arg/opine family amino acid ABC transporter permease subunit
LGYQWNFAFLWKYLPVLVKGLLVTFELTLISCLLGTLLGVLLVVLRVSPVRVVRTLTAAYIETTLAIPLLVWLVWLNYCGPQISRFLAFDRFTVAWLSLTLALAPFAAETFRGAYISMSPSYALAGRACGMTRSQIFLCIEFPLLVQRSFPVMFSHYVTMLKIVSVCAIIAVPELIHTSMIIISTEYRPLEVYTAAGVIYLLATLPFTLLARVAERRFVAPS